MITYATCGGYSKGTRLEVIIWALPTSSCVQQSWGVVGLWIAQVDTATHLFANSMRRFGVVSFKFVAYWLVQVFWSLTQKIKLFRKVHLLFQIWSTAGLGMVLEDWWAAGDGAIRLLRGCLQNTIVWKKKVWLIIFFSTKSRVVAELVVVVVPSTVLTHWFGSLLFHLNDYWKNSLSLTSSVCHRTEPNFHNFYILTFIRKICFAIFDSNFNWLLLYKKSDFLFLQIIQSAFRLQIFFNETASFPQIREAFTVRILSLSGWNWPASRSGTVALYSHSH